jgi:hypothetical protein
MADDHQRGRTKEGRRLYDEEFWPAVHLGFLTTEEAVRRGTRVEYAHRLAQKYGLNRKQALRVTDNRSTLCDALRECGYIRAKPRRLRGMGRSGRLQVATTLAGVLALTALFGGHKWHEQATIGRKLEEASIAAFAPAPTAPPTAPARKSGKEVERNETGEVTSVSGRTPVEAMIALCDEIPIDGCWQMEVVPTDPPFPGQRLGMYSSPIAVDDLKTVVIRRERRTGRWAIRSAGLAGPVPAQADCEARDGSDCS